MRTTRWPILIAGVLASALLARDLRAQESIFALQFLGVSEETGDGRARGLGVLGVGLDDSRTSIVLNPASLGSLDHMTISAMGVTGVRSSRSETGEDDEGVARFPHQRVSLPLFGKVVFTTGFNGLRNFKGEFALGERGIDGLAYEQRFKRNGTLYILPLGLAGSVGSKLRLGATLDVLIGTVDEQWITQGDSILALSSRRRDKMTGRTVTLGFLALPTQRVALGVSWSPEFTIDRSTRWTLEDAILGTGSAPLRDESFQKDIRYPQVVRIGGQLRPHRDWLLTSDYMWREWSAYDGSLYEAESIGNEWRFGAGAEWKRQGRTAWRLGFSRQRWPQKVNDNRLDETTLHLGFGVDLSADAGRLDLALERAWIGSLAENAQEEDVWRFVISLSGQEIWKRKSPRGE